MLNGSLPAFGLGAGQALAAGARALALAGLFGLLGTLGLRLIAARALARTIAGERATRRLAWGSLALFAVGLGGWVVAQAALLTEATSVGASFRAVGPVIASTEFGHLATAQAGIAALAGMAFAAGWAWPAGALAAGAVLLQSGHLHAWAMEPGVSALLACEALHLLAASAWLGALPALGLLVLVLPPDDAWGLSRRFSVLGGVAVLVIAATAGWQGWTLSGGLPDLLGTAYGWTELLKLGLFGLMLGCAVANRWRFTPRLAGPAAGRAKRALAHNIALETALGLLVIIAATVLTSLEPGMHAQPVWPFREQPSLMIVREDPVFRQEVADAVLAIVGALALIALGFLVRWVRWVRWVAWAAALVIGWFAVPHLDLLFVPAYPTSFFRSPTGFAATSIVEGAALYSARCAACHGSEGRGDGPAGKGLDVPPADLTAEHLWAHSDGELFWWLSHGMVSPAETVAMPGFADTLSEDQRWALIDYIRAHNAGLTWRATRAWSPPVQAPALEATCADAKVVTLADLRGRVVRLAFGAAVGDAAGAVTIGVGSPVGTQLPTSCSTDDPAVPEAYAIVAGMDATQLKGTQILIDANGWLQDAIPPDTAGSIGAAIESIARQPLPADAAKMQHHMPM